MHENILIRKGSFAEAVKLTLEISEFENPHKEEVYLDRLSDKDHLILIATVNNEPAGFKVGYDKFGDGSFYTWMGGVKSEFRRMGIAKKLADTQEEYAVKQGYNSIILKTRNRHKNMLVFAINNGFKIIEIMVKEHLEENRIILKKQLL